MGGAASSVVSAAAVTTGAVVGVEVGDALFLKQNLSEKAF